jgi:hypothetical protein
MIKVTADEATRILTVEAHGMVSEADIETALDNLQERFPQVGVRLSGGAKGGIRMFLDWEHLEGWEMGAKTSGTMAGKMMSDVVHRVAVVADAKWKDEQERLADVGKRANVRFFTLDQREKAMQWLRED